MPGPGISGYQVWYSLYSLAVQSVMRGRSNGIKCHTVNNATVAMAAVPPKGPAHCTRQQWCHPCHLSCARCDGPCSTLQQHTASGGSGAAAVTSTHCSGQHQATAVPLLPSLLHPMRLRLHNPPTAHRQRQEAMSLPTPPLHGNPVQPTNNHTAHE